MSTCTSTGTSSTATTDERDACKCWRWSGASIRGNSRQVYLRIAFEFHIGGCGSQHVRACTARINGVWDLLEMNHLQSCDMIDNGNRKRRNNREMCYWITCMVGFNPSNIVNPNCRGSCTFEAVQNRAPCQLLQRCKHDSRFST
jgi:hypothetical protein